MTRFVAPILLLSTALALTATAQNTPATKSATAPTTKSVAAQIADKIKATTQPATRTGANKPVTKPTTAKTDSKTTDLAAKSADEHFPTPAELMEKIKAKRANVDKLLKVAHVDLAEPVAEKAPELTLFGNDRLVTTHNLLDRLHRARDDKNLRAVLITLGSDSNFNAAQALEIRTAINELRKAGKRTFVYADTYDTTAYLAASAATDVCLLEGGELMMMGVDIEPTFLKGLFDKVGVKADMIQIGEYKGADEQYTRTELSPESRGELTKIADSLYNLMVDTIAYNRNLDKPTVKNAIDNVFLRGKAALDRGFVDHLTSAGELRDLITGELGGDINVLPNYAMPEREKLDFSSPFALLGMLGGKKAAASGKPAIALINADGVIVDGEAGDGIMGASGNVGSENLRKAFRAASRDDNVKAIVLRIDSPGGSALASEVMWQAINAAAQDKPVIVSVGSMAASGGYYIAAAGDYIFADPSAIVGSIGVVGGKFVVTGLFEKLGVTTDSITRGKNADLFSMSKEWNDKQKRLVANWMKSTYEQFTERVMAGRAGKIKDIDQVARGRVFLAKQALELGMVDEIGGLSEAIKFAAAEADLKEYDVKPLPGSRSIIDILSGNVEGPEARMPFKVNLDSPLIAMPPSMRKILAQQLQLMQILDKRPVMLVAPFSVTIK